LQAAVITLLSPLFPGTACGVVILSARAARARAKDLLFFDAASFR